MSVREGSTPAARGREVWGEVGSSKEKEKDLGREREREREREKEREKETGRAKG